ncbi:hypothetical protein L596_010356 [Steinernema carpocapsae]|uniref:Histidine acid phosphatase n=1 Tax=Steinernema carpocapsae TaxID=34508 RepID=A0A4U5PIE5_STECR|nr:hypothetical protein L596_010356 [Steinernema carpocapsae]
MSPLRMSRLNSLLLLSFVGLGLGHELPEESVAIDNATLLVFFGTRHGNRNPEQFIPDTPRNWGQEGEIELTSFGKRQGYGLGEELRKFADSLIQKNFQPSEAKFFSSSANRCQMTLQAALAGLYPPQSYAVFDSALDWTPVPYTIDDPMLRMYAVSPCPNSDAAWRPISQDTLPALANLTQESRPLLEYMAEKTGWKPTISNAADLADSLLNIALFNASLPAWIAHPSLEGYSAASLRAAFLAFAENHQIACAEYAPCRI